jgi:hypothetical protein
MAARETLDNLMPFLRRVRVRLSQADFKRQLHALHTTLSQKGMKLPLFRERGGRFERLFPVCKVSNDLRDFAGLHALSSVSAK